MQSWSLLPDISASMPFQMALDEVLFNRYQNAQEASLGPMLRFYYSDIEWTSIGRLQKWSTNGKAQVCRRMTGGGAVKHGKDLMFSLLAPKQAHPSFRKVSESYVKMHEALQDAFASLNVTTRFYRCNENLPRGGECFKYPIVSDLAWNDQKIAGGAQKRSAHALIHQESIQPVQGLCPKALRRALIQSFERFFSVTINPVCWNPDWLAEAESVCAPVTAEAEEILV